jgi:hypothetical protein
MQGMHVRLDINLRVPIPKMDLDDDDEDDEGDGDRLILTHWLKQNKIVLSLSCMVSLFSQSNRTHSKFDCQSSIYKTPSVALYMELEFFFQMNLCPSPYIGWDPGMWTERNEEKLLQGKKQKPQATKRELASFWYRLKGKG